MGWYPVPGSFGFVGSGQGSRRDVRYGHGVTQAAPPGEERVRAAEVIAGLSLATDLGIGVSLEHGLESTLFAMRLADRLGVDQETMSQTYYACLLFYVGCTANADLAAELFGEDDALTTHATPVRFGSRPQMMAGMLRAVAPPDGAPLLRAVQIARGLPRLRRVFPGVVAAICEVGRMLTDRLGLPPSVSGLFAYVGERWDGKGDPGGAKGEEIPLPVRIVHVARDAAFQRMLGGWEFAADTIRDRAGHAFAPDIGERLADEAEEILALEGGESLWETTLSAEPKPWLWLEGEEIDRALRAMGDFTDLASPYLAGHSEGVAELVATAAQLLGLGAAEVTMTRRAALLHDLGRVAVPVRIWQHEGPLGPDDWERVRLHAYHTERVLTPSPFLATLAQTASFHHERLDGTGYHRGAAGPGLGRSARILAAADVYRAMTEPRPYRGELAPESAAQIMVEEAQAGRLDADAVGAVLEAAGRQAPLIERPAGLTDRESEVIALLARGWQTKQIARALDISPNTADRHIQHAYRKMGVSTRAAAALFAMEHGLLTWGEFTIGKVADRQ